MFENRIKEKCSKVFNNSSNVEIIKRLELGMSNYMFLISVDDNRIVAIFIMNIQKTGDISLP